MTPLRLLLGKPCLTCRAPACTAATTPGPTQAAGIGGQGAARAGRSGGAAGGAEQRVGLRQRGAGRTGADVDGPAAQGDVSSLLTQSRLSLDGPGPLAAGSCRSAMLSYASTLTITARSSPPPPRRDAPPRVRRQPGRLRSRKAACRTKKGDFTYREPEPRSSNRGLPETNKKDISPAATIRV